MRTKPKYRMGYTLDEDLQVVKEVRAYVSSESTLRDDLAEATDRLKARFNKTYFYEGVCLFNHDYYSTSTQQ